MKAILSVLCIALLVAQGFSDPLVSPLGETYIKSTQKNQELSPTFEVQIQNPITLANPTDTPKYDTAHVFLALYTSDAAFRNEAISTDPENPAKCKNMVPIAAEAFKDLQTDVKKAQFTFSELDGPLATGNVVLETSNWAATSFIAASTCSPVYYFMGDKVNGFIGMGHDGDAAKRFKHEGQTFAVNFEYLKDVPNAADHYERKVFFNPYLKQSIRGKPLQTLVVNANNVAAPESGIKVTVKDTPLDAGKLNVIFDINYNFIGIPGALFDQIIPLLKTDTNSVNKADTTFQDKTCNDTNSECFKALPNITLTIGDAKLDITPQEYVDLSDNENPRFGLKWLDATKIFNWNLHSNFATNYIVIGESWMKDYYTVFDGKNNKVEVYPNEDLTKLGEKKKAEEDAERERKEKEEKEKKEKEEKERKEKEEKERKEKEEKEKKEKEEKDKKDKEDKEKKDKEDKEKKEKEEAEKKRSPWFYIIIVGVVIVVIAAAVLLYLKFGRKTGDLNAQYQAANDESDVFAIQPEKKHTIENKV